MNMRSLIDGNFTSQWSPRYKLCEFPHCSTVFFPLKSRILLVGYNFLAHALIKLVQPPSPRRFNGWLSLYDQVSIGAKSCRRPGLQSAKRGGVSGSHLSSNSFGCNTPREWALLKTVVDLLVLVLRWWVLNSAPTRPDGIGISLRPFAWYFFLALALILLFH